MDKFTKEQRSKIMSAIHSRDTLPEIVVRKWLHANGFRFRVCDKRLVGHPDVVLPRLKTLIEIRGCFWHRHGWTWNGHALIQTADCSHATSPKTNRGFWTDKFRRNVRRDQEHEKLWLEQGWTVIVIWECALVSVEEREKTFGKVLKWLRKPSRGKA